jgi:hypothetical protein
MALNHYKFFVLTILTYACVYIRSPYKIPVFIYSYSPATLINHKYFVFLHFTEIGVIAEICISDWSPAHRISSFAEW